MSRWLRWLALAAPLAPAPAAELAGWHGIDLPVRLPRKLELTLHHRTRIRHQLRHLDDSRAGALLHWSATPRLIPFAGYYYQPQQDVPGLWVQSHRVLVGLESPLRVHADSSLTTRLTIERLFYPAPASFNRYRSYARLTIGGRRIAPFFQHELLMANSGYYSTRGAGGLRIRLSESVSLDTGYLFESRRAVFGGDRQAIVTSIRIQKPEK